MTVGEIQESEPAAPAERAAVLPFGPKRRWVGGLAVAAALVLAVLLVPAIRERLLPGKTGVPALVAASESLESRRIEGRLSGGFAHRPEKGSFRTGRATSPDPELWRVYGVTADLLDRALKTRAADDRRALGVAYLVAGDYQEAIVELEAALGQGQRDGVDPVRASRDAPLLSDLAAAYLARNRATGQSSDLAAALEAAERSWQLQKTPEAAWNRALALEAMHGAGGADRAWSDYLALDSTSPWADEARQKSGRVE